MEIKDVDYASGAVLLFNKPLKWTSFDVVKKVRYFLNNVKTGHAGTLDPLATGLLIICTGKFTKRIEEFQGQPKEYTGTLTLGATRPSYDMETEINQEFDISGITEEQIRNAAGSLTGNLLQYPPKYSANKIDGERAYDKSRRGEEFEVRRKEVFVEEFEITRIELPEVDFRIRCSKGTYIRSLAHDLGALLNNGAYLSALCRTKIGTFDLKDAWEIDDFINKVKEDRLRKTL